MNFGWLWQGGGSIGITQTNLLIEHPTYKKNLGLSKKMLYSGHCYEGKQSHGNTIQCFLTSVFAMYVTCFYNFTMLLSIFLFFYMQIFTVGKFKGGHYTLHFQIS